MFIGFIFLLPALYSAYKIWHFDYTKRWYAFKHIVILFFTGLFSFILLALTAMSGVGHSQPSGMSIQEENFALAVNMIAFGLSAIAMLTAIYKSIKARRIRKTS